MAGNILELMALFEEIDVSCLVPIHKRRDGWIHLIRLTDHPVARELSIKIDDIRDHLFRLEETLMRGVTQDCLYGVVDEYIKFYKLYVESAVMLARILDQIEMEFGTNLPVDELFIMTKVITMDWNLYFCPLEDVIWLEPLKCATLAKCGLKSELN